MVKAYFYIDGVFKPDLTRGMNPVPRIGETVIYALGPISGRRRMMIVDSVFHNVETGTQFVEIHGRTVRFSREGEAQ